MTTKNYDYKAFIDVFVQTRRRDFLHEDFSNYYQGLLETLESIFGMKISKGDDSSSLAIWMLFRSTADSYLSIRTPWSYFIEAGIIGGHLDRKEDLARETHRLSHDLEDLARTSRQKHLALLHNLFHHLYGETDKVFTSLDLLKNGFDDSKEPQMADYDYLL